jgi:hypothetical protein
MGEGERGLLRPGVMNRQGTPQSVRVHFQPLLKYNFGPPRLAQP